MPTNKLTDAQCRGAKPSERPYKLFDGGGMYLWVSQHGNKSWRLAYRVAGKPKTISLGSYPELSLAEARKKRGEHKSVLREGGDPMSARSAKRKGISFSAAVDSFWGGRHDVSPDYRENAVRGIKMHLKNLLDTNIASITREDLLTALNVLNACGKYSYVRKVLLWSRQVFDHAVEHGHATINPAALIKPSKAFGNKKVQSFAALEPREIPDFMARISLEHRLQSVLACMMLAYTWVRTNELRMMLWSEIDYENFLWIIPQGKMKRARDHVVPLSSQAIEILKEQKSRSRGSIYVFPSDHRIDRPMSENAVLYLLHRIGYKGRMTGHGWRSVASTWANERGYNADAIEMQLSHAPENKTRSVYNRSKYLNERRKMLQEFSDWIGCQRK